jgi:hypothetical protein
MSTTNPERSVELQALMDANKAVFENFEELLRNPEPLHPDLALYMDDTAWFGK